MDLFDNLTTDEILLLAITVRATLNPGPPNGGPKPLVVVREADRTRQDDQLDPNGFCLPRTTRPDSFPT